MVSVSSFCEFLDQYPGCRPCLKGISKRLQEIDGKLERESHEFKDGLDEDYLLRFRSDRELLSDLLPKTGKQVSENS